MNDYPSRRTAAQARLTRLTEGRVAGRVLTGALLVAAVGMAGAAAGPAALAAPLTPASSSTSASSAPGGGIISWSISTATATAPDFRNKYNYTNVKPGSTITDHIAVFNKGSESVAFELYGSDATGTTASNVLIFLPATKTPTDIGSWVFFQHKPQQSIIISAHTGEIVPFTIVVPRNATPGDHTGGVFAQVSFNRTSKKGQVVTESQRIGAPIYLRVSGPLHAGLRVEAVSVGSTGTISPAGSSSLSVTYTVQNTGKVRLAGSQAVSVSGLFGGSLSTGEKALPTLLPGDSVRFTARPGSLYPFGPITAHVRVGPAAPAGAVPLAAPMADVTGSASLFAVPWALLVVIVLVIGLIIGLWQLFRWRRRKLGDTLVEVAEHARKETERRLLGQSGKSSSAKPQGKA